MRRCVPRAELRASRAASKDAGMQARHDDSGRARIARPASLSPKLDRDEKRVNRDNHGTENLAITIIKYAWNLPDPQPDGCANKDCEGQEAPAVEQTHSVPDHAAGEEGQCAGHHRGQGDY